MKSVQKNILLPYSQYLLLQKGSESSVKSPVPEHSRVKASATSKEREVGEEKSSHSESTILSLDGVLLNLPESLKTRARTFLEALKRQHGVEWNEKGEVTLRKYGKVEGSHIADLVKDAVVSYKHFKPRGVAEFYSSLQNFPASLVRNPERRALLLQKAPPPPGIPKKVITRTLANESISKPRRRYTESRIKWKRLR